MPRKTFTVDYCDYCASEEDGKEVEASETITINGREALACERHAKPVLKMLQTFMNVSAPLATADGHGPTPTRRRQRKPASDGNGQPTGDMIRAWAREENDRAKETVYVVSDTGKLRTAVIEAYKAAHGSP